MHQALQGATFHVEHIIPRTKGGGTERGNLAFACPSCNLHKADRTHAMDLMTGSAVRLSHPQEDHWGEQFRFNGDEVEGLTEVGHATLAALDLNHPRRVRIREAERKLCVSEFDAP